MARGCCGMLGENEGQLERTQDCWERKCCQDRTHASALECRETARGSWEENMGLWERRNHQEGTHVSAVVCLERTRDSWKRTKGCWGEMLGEITHDCSSVLHTHILLVLSQEITHQQCAKAPFPLMFLSQERSQNFRCCCVVLWCICVTHN